ncbi:hypothetical protein [Saccharopolyspora hattusasensis]|uniref:hypothetical protein n=1 Tax=Saccharopolyspora hattusasensis TaxID=1128679 RepID=UPI003D983FDC
MPKKVTRPAPLLWVYRCQAQGCQFEDRYADVVAQHERDAHYADLRTLGSASSTPGGAAK